MLPVAPTTSTVMRALLSGSPVGPQNVIMTLMASRSFIAR